MTLSLAAVTGITSHPLIGYRLHTWPEPKATGFGGAFVRDSNTQSLLYGLPPPIPPMLNSL
jgi:hypothetical protein